MAGYFRRVFFWSTDLFNNRGRIYHQYKNILDYLTQTNHSNRVDKFIEIKKHAIENTDFYSKMKIEDIFPVVNKDIIRHNYGAFKSKTGFELPLHISSTSGSTGTPFSIVQDHVKRCRNIADLKAFGQLFGYKSHFPMLFFRIKNERLQRTRTKVREFLENIYYIDSSNLDDVNLEKWRELLLKKKPHTIFSYPTTLEIFVDFLERKGDSSNAFKIQRILTAGEMIPQNTINRLERLFGCSLIRRYSNMELGILAQDMGSQDRRYLLNTSSYYFECLSLDSDEPVKFGELGRIVITDLFNYAMPLIRYDTGDLGIFEEDSNTSEMYLKEIYGRSRDCIYSTRGGVISPAAISVKMWGLDKVKQWQFVQNNKNEYYLKINSDECLNTGQIILKLKELLGDDANIQIEYLTEIPVLSSNKRKAVICNYKPTTSMS